VTTSGRLALLRDIIRMSFDTLFVNKLRSGLTVLGVVIGVTSIVAMTAMIRGFGDNMRELFQQMGTDTVYVARFSLTSFAAGKDFWEVMKRTPLHEADAAAIKEQAPSAGIVTYTLGEGPGMPEERFVYRNNSTKRMGILGADASWLRVNFLRVAAGRFFSELEVQRRRPVIVLGAAPAEVLFPNTDPLGKQVRFGQHQYTVVGVLDKRPAVLGGSVDDFAIVPATTFDKNYRAFRFRGVLFRFVTISAVPRDGATREHLMREIEEILRNRHRLKLDQENDFDLYTADSLLKVVDQMTSAVVLALVVISSIALTVGGIGVMAIMSISVTERTREIGVRRAIGATKAGILWQFLIEAVVVTSVGGLLGALVGALIGIAVNSWAGFPLALPWWSFVLGVGFSAVIGLFFGLFPAFKAARLDPIEALRHE